MKKQILIIFCSALIGLTGCKKSSYYYTEAMLFTENNKQFKEIFDEYNKKNETQIQCEYLNPKEGKTLDNYLAVMTKNGKNHLPDFFTVETEAFKSFKDFSCGYVDLSSSNVSLDKYGNLFLGKTTDVMFYNSTYLTNNSYSVPATFDEAITLARSIKAKDNSIIPLYVSNKIDLCIELALQDNINAYELNGDLSSAIHNNQYYQDIIEGYINEGIVTTNDDNNFVISIDKSYQVNKYISKSFDVASINYGNNVALVKDISLCIPDNNNCHNNNLKLPNEVKANVASSINNSTYSFDNGLYKEGQKTSSNTSLVKVNNIISNILSNQTNYVMSSYCSNYYSLF